MIKKALLSTAFAGIISLLHADVLELKDGSRLEGNLQKIHEGTVYYETGFAGVLEISQDEVLNIETSDPVFLKTQDGEVFRGNVAVSETGLTVNSGSGSVNTQVDAIASGWEPGEEDPVVVQERQAIQDQIRDWSYEAGVDISGSDGNSEESTTALNFSATLEGPSDRLNFYGSYEYKENNGVASTDETKGGVRYTSFFSEHWGWFVREELEMDEFEGIDFRSTSAAGLTYRFINREKMNLEGNFGFSYRYDDYVTGTSESYPGLDLGLLFDWQFAEWAELTSELGYVPSINDFGEYLFTHESGVNIPLSTSDQWKLRLGVAHEYNANPEPGREELDTSYFVRLLLSWD